MAVAVPVVIYGIATSPVEPLPDMTYMLEGRSLVYLAVLNGLKGPIPPGYDIMLSPTALAGWAGLLITMINLLPFGQLDGGHIAYALLGRRQDQFSRYVLRLLPVLAIVVSAAYGIPSYIDGARGERLAYDASAGMHWLVWALVLWALTRATGPRPPPHRRRPGVAPTPCRRLVDPVAVRPAVHAIMDPDAVGNFTELPEFLRFGPCASAAT